MQLTHSAHKTHSSRFVIRTENDFASKIVRWSWVTFFVCVLYQCVFFFELTNFIAIAAVALGWIITTRVFLKTDMFQGYPLSAYIILGFTSTELYLPLLFTTLEGKPLIYNLELPEQVFLHTTLALFVLVLAHSFYRMLARISYSRSFSILTKTGFFIPPKDLQLWIMGLIGMAASFYVYFMTPEVGWEVTGGSASDKMIQGLMPFSYAPFFIPFSQLYGNHKPHSKQLIPMLILFTVILFAIGIGRNSTGALMFGFTAIGFAYILALLLGVFKDKLFSFKNFAIGGLAVWALVGPLADLRTAMVLVRGERLEIPAMELLSLTLEAYSDKEAIRERREYDSDQAVDTDWDERYLDNVFTARFANIKFNDASLACAAVVSEYDPDMLEYSIDYIFGALPEPFLKALSLDVDKERVYSLTIGDYLYVTAGGYGFVEGFRTGHFAGTGMATFGWWYLLILGVFMIPIFLLFDKFYRKKDESTGQTNLQFSFCGILALTSIFHFLSPLESVIMLPIFLIRGWIQMALLYFVMFHFTRMLTGSKRIKIKFGSK